MIIGQIHTPFPDHILSGISMPNIPMAFLIASPHCLASNKRKFLKASFSSFQNRKIMVKLIEFFSQVISVISQ